MGSRRVGKPPEIGAKAGMGYAEMQDLPEGSGQRESAAAKATWRRWVPLAVLVAASISALCILWYQGGVSFETIKQNSAWLHGQVNKAPLLSGICLFGLYTVVTALSLPIATLVTVFAGYFFGILVASLWVIGGATLGSVIVFLAARGVLHDVLMARAAPWLKRMEKGFQEDALSYLLVLRLLPIFPFWLVNLVPALLGVKLWIYVLATALGIIPGVVVYAALGNGLGTVIAQGGEPDFAIILDPAVLLPLVGLAVFALLPVAWKRWQRRRRADA